MIVLILGMHRSGTSAVAGMLKEGGLYLGDVFMPAMEENPKGFFEDLRFQNVNKKILESIGKSWDNPPSFEELHQVPIQIKNLIIQVFNLFQRQNVDWAWKDPRIALTFPLWYQTLRKEELKLIYCLRNPIAVANSLNKRNSLPLEKGIALWEIYNQRIIDILERTRLPFMFVHYEKLIDSPEEVQTNLEHFLCKKLNNAWKFIEKELNRSSSELNDKFENTSKIYIDIISKYDK